jgi:hypothetical protein
MDALLVAPQSHVHLHGANLDAVQAGDAAPANGLFEAIHDSPLR